MPTVKNLKELQDYINKQAQKALQDDIGRTVHAELTKFVLDKLYNAYEASDDYQRTYELLRSITIDTVKKDRDNYIISVFFDPDTMNHTSIYGSTKLGISPGENVYIAQWVNDGWTWNRPVVGYMEATMAELERVKPHIKAFIGYLSSKGIVIK